MAETRKLELQVYTGTSGVMELKDVKDKMVPIYLYNKTIVPVPR